MLPTLSRRELAVEKRAMKVGLALSLIWLASFAIGFKPALAVITFCGFGLAAIGLRWPMYGLVGIGVLCSVDAITRTYLMTGGLLRYNTFNYWLLMVMLFTLPMQLKQRDIHSWLLRVFAMLLIAELIWSPGFKNGVLNILNFVTVFGLFAYFYRCRANPRMWTVLALTVGLSSATGGAAFFLNGDELSFTQARAEYLANDIFDRNYIDPNALSYFFVTGIFSLTFGLTSNTSKGTERLVLYALFATNLCWIFLVGSRGAMLVGSACALFLLFSARSTSRRFQVITLAVLATLIFINAFPEYRDRTVHRVDKMMDEDLTAAQRTSSRSDMAIGAWRMFVKNPVGVGTGGFEKSWATREYTAGLSKQKAGREKSAHSAWLKTIAENGLPGIVIFTCFVFSFVYAGIKKGKSGAIAVGMLVSFSIGLCFLSTQFQAKGIWFIVAAGIVYIHHRIEISHTPRPRRKRPKPRLA
jgi:hypothetical protein